MASASRTAARDRIAEIRARFGSEPPPPEPDEVPMGAFRRRTHAFARGLNTLGIGVRKRRHRIEQVVEKYREESEAPETAPSEEPAYPFPSVKMIAEKIKEEEDARRSTAQKGRRPEPELPSAGMFSGKRQSASLFPSAEKPTASQTYSAPPTRNYPEHNVTTPEPAPPRNRIFGEGFVMFTDPWRRNRSK